jgi:hypothetical protein
VHVPPLKQLKVQSGDPYPELGLLEKLAVTLLRRERPFDGRCHRCGAPAAYAVPTEFTFLEERIVSGDEGIVITPLFSMATVGASEEHWRTFNVPLAFCQGCRRTFEADRKAAFWNRLIIRLLLLLIAGPILLLVLVGVALVLPIAMLVVLGFAVAQSGRGPRLPQWLRPYLRQLPWYERTIDNESEFRFRVGRVGQYDEIMRQIPREETLAC